ncbi:MAG: triose-phosphate isomerase [Terriglobia bacterium]|jgi:triosephosphate isomerase
MRTSRLFVGTSWKMNKTVREAVDYTRRLLGLLEGLDRSDAVQVFVVPPFTAIEAVRRASEGKLWVGAQNMHWAERGAYTGEISAAMLQELGVDLVELGHAERRRYFNETDADVNRKVHAALRHGLRPLVCVGELAEDKRRGVGRETVRNQVRTGFAEVEASRASHLIVAYEPVWAIGADRADIGMDYVREVQNHIRATLEEMLGPSAAALVPVIYGGDVNLRNAASLVTESGTDGLFIGRAALEAENFAELIRTALQAIG